MSLGRMRISPSLVIPDDELEFTAIRARGPGGQHVNKIATAVQLRFDARASRALSNDTRAKLLAHRDQRITANGVVVIRSQLHRSQFRNKEDAKDKLRKLITTALATRAPRKKTRPPRASNERRLELKARRSRLKKSRRITED
jgi:ribosome-associated protein